MRKPASSCKKRPFQGLKVNKEVAQRMTASWTRCWRRLALVTATSLELSTSAWVEKQRTQVEHRMVRSLCFQLILRSGYLAKGQYIPVAKWLAHMTSSPQTTRVICILPLKERNNLLLVIFVCYHMTHRCLSTWRWWGCAGPRGTLDPRWWAWA